MASGGKFFLLMLLMLGAVLLGCGKLSEEQQSQRTDPINTTEDSLHHLLSDYYDTMSKRDWPAYRRFFWENATLTTIWQPAGEQTARVVIVTIDDFIRLTPEGPDSQPIFEEKMKGEPEMTIKGNVATIWADYDAKFGTEDKLMEWSGKDVFTLMRHEGSWKIVSLAYE